MPFARLPADDPLAPLQARLREALGDPPAVHLFDEDGHRYADAAGLELPSVGQILKSRKVGPSGRPLNGYGSARPDVLDRGRRVAEKVAGVEASGLQWWSKPDLDVAPFLASWLAFKAAVGWRTLAVEHALGGMVMTPAGGILNYAGTPDTTGVMTCPPPWMPPADLVVLEGKSGSIPASGGPQCAAYCLAVAAKLPGLRIAGLVLRMDRDGNAPRLERKRTKGDGLKILVFNDAGPGLQGIADDVDTVPLRGDLRAVTTDDVKTFLDAAVDMVAEDQAAGIPVMAPAGWLGMEAR